MADSPATAQAMDEAMDGVREGVATLLDSLADGYSRLLPLYRSALTDGNADPEEIETVKSAARDACVSLAVYGRALDRIAAGPYSNNLDDMLLLSRGLLRELADSYTLIAEIDPGEFGAMPVLEPLELARAMDMAALRDWIAQHAGEL